MNLTISIFPQKSFAYKKIYRAVCSIGNKEFIMVGKTHTEALENVINYLKSYEKDYIPSE